MLILRVRFETRLSEDEFLEVAKKKGGTIQGNSRTHSKVLCQT